ncbi:MAG: oligosaccharide flippase family protein [Blastocatellia bacterium]
MSFAKATAEPGSFAGQAIWMITAKGVALALALALPLILARLFHQEEMGLYRQAFQILTTSLSLLGLQVAATTYYFTPREPDRKSQVVLNVLLFYLSIGVIVASLFICFPRWITPIMNGEGLVPIMPLLGGAILLWLVGLNLECVPIALGDIRWSAVTTVLMQLMKTSLLVAAALIGGSVRAMLIAAVVIGIVHCSVYLTYLRRKFGNFWEGFDWSLLKAQLANALPFGIGSIVYVVQFDMHHYYVSAHFSAAEFAVYSIGCFQLPILQVLIEGMETVLLPEISRLENIRDFKQIFNVWTNSVRMLAFFFFPVCSVLFVLRWEFIETLFTAKYFGATAIFAINLFNLLLYVLLIGALLRAFPELKYFRIKFCVVLLPITFAALHFGLKAGGMVGVIAAVALTRLFDAGVTLVAIGRRLKLTLGDLKQFAALWRLAVVALIAALVTELVKLAMTGLPVQLILALGSLAYGAVYLVALFLSGAVTPAEQLQLRALWQKFFRFGVMRTNISSATEVQ